MYEKCTKPHNTTPLPHFLRQPFTRDLRELLEKRQHFSRTFYHTLFNSSHSVAQGSNHEFDEPADITRLFSGSDPTKGPKIAGAAGSDPKSARHTHRNAGARERSVTGPRSPDGTSFESFVK